MTKPADADAGSSEPEAQAPRPGAPPTEGRLWVTRHELAAGGPPLAYTASAGTLLVRDGDGVPKAQIFHVAYTADDVADSSQRPITFVFNGGPGSASVWLHLGVLGPRRVVVPRDLHVAPPYPLEPNPWTLLRHTDLVFVDPVSTGFSRAVEGEDPRQFHGIDEDVACLGEFIRLYATRNGRWLSPKYLVGESYGTTRAAELACHLQDRHGMSVNGVVFISAVLDFATARCDWGNDVAFAMALPTMAVAALHHGRSRRGPDDLAGLAAEAEGFALDDYLPTLLRGSRATENEVRRMVKAAAAYMGLSPEYLERCNLRVTPARFRKELLRSERRTIGRFDVRCTGTDADAAGDVPDDDASYPPVQGPFTAAANHYLRSELGYEEDLPYHTLNSEAVQPWNFGDKGRGRYVDAGAALRTVMAKNHSLRVFLASGYHDLATPYFAAEWSLERLGLDPPPGPRIQCHRYPGGHMMYLHEPEVGLLHDDLAAFVAAWR